MKCNLVLDEAEVLHINIMTSNLIYLYGKGMGNGFPIGGILIAPHFKAYGLLGTLAEVIWLAASIAFRYYRKSELDAKM
jgi:hypothetical protein